MKSFKWFFIVALGSVILLSGCNNDEEPRTANDKINNWIYQRMESWYYWTDELREKPPTNSYPGDFYSSLLVDQDRFSFIYDDYQELIDLLNGVQLESGYEFKLYFEPGSEVNVIILITYIKKGSPADDIGLKRGDVIYSINDTQITETNYRTLLNELESPYQAKYRRYDWDVESFIDQGEIAVSPITVTENPLLIDTVFELAGKKIGYLVFTQFSNGPTSGSNIYNEQMDLIFSNFKNQGITEFILDLRFNGGGSEVSAINLASLMVAATEDDLMFKKQYNEGTQGFFKNDSRYGEAFLNIKFTDKEQNIGNQIGNTIHVITSNRSASASELVLNSALPYMDIFVVGDTTVGKDVGSATFTDESNTENNWAIQPIIVKIVNANDMDYPTGFYPDVPLEDNFLILRPLGDINEPLLNAALSEIGVQNARKINDFEKASSPPLFESLDEKFGDGKLFMENTPSPIP